MLRADTSIFYDDNLSLQHNIIWYIWKKTQASIAWPFPTREAWHFCVDLTKNGKDVQVMMAWPSLFVRINDCPWTPKPWEMKVSILKKYGLCPLKMRVLGSHGMIYIYIDIFWAYNFWQFRNVCVFDQTKNPRSYEKTTPIVEMKSQGCGMFTRKKHYRIKILSRQELVGGGWTNPVETYHRHFSKPCSVLVKPINQRKLCPST